VSVQPFGKTAAKVRPGQTATYIVWVWTTGADAKNVTIDLSTGDSKIKRTSAPGFSICPNASGTRCTLGNLPQDQADELQARISVWKIATTGKNLTLTATANAKDAKPFRANGDIAVVAAPAPPADPQPTDPPPGDGGTLPPAPPSLPALPPAPAPIAGASDPAGLFPTVTPSPSSAAASGRAAPHRTRVRATSAGNTLPLNTRLIGGQLAGLVILAAAIAIAVARLSFRPQRPDSPPDDD
jgi:hypothetical protein